MKKKMLIALLSTVVVIFITYTNLIGFQKFVPISDLVLANIEALAQDDEADEKRYDIRKEEEVEIWDDATETYKKVIVIICEGKGSLSC